MTISVIKTAINMGPVQKYMNKKIKTLIIYETGIHYIIIINEKR